MAHKHSVYDSDSHFSINPITRTITNMSSQKTTLMQYDHNSERFTFELPRYIEGHDMSTCDRVEVHYLNIEANTKTQNEGVYEVEDLQVSPDDDNIVICSWLISHNATQLVGSINFVLRFACTGDSETQYAWNTAIFSGISVSTGMNNTESSITPNVDILQQWYNRFMLVGYDRVVNATDDAVRTIADLTTEKAEFLSQTGGAIVSEDEPDGEHVKIWVNPTPNDESIALLDSTDITHELSDDLDKIPSVALLKQVAESSGGGTGDATIDPTPYGLVMRDEEGDISLPEQEADFISSGVHWAVSAHTVHEYVSGLVGDISTVLDAIIAKQNELIGGDS